MKKRISRYNVRFWARDFMTKLKEVRQYQHEQTGRNMISTAEEEMLTEYRAARRAILFLDYDGTLVGFKDSPEKARPDDELIALVKALTEKKQNRVVVISGRQPQDLDDFFNGLDVELAGGHGSWTRMKVKNGRSPSSFQLSGRRQYGLFWKVIPTAPRVRL